MTSSLKHVAALRAALEAALNDLLDHCSLTYNDINRGSSITVVGWCPWRWDTLGADGQAAIKPARELEARWRAFCENAVRVGAPERAQSFSGKCGVVERVLEQSDDFLGASAISIDEVRDKVRAALDHQQQVVQSLPTAHGAGERLMVADTSALLDRPDLQNWRLDGDVWTIVALPQVLSELDDKKRDPKTRDAANKVIRQLTDFDRRGDTLAGVKVAGNVTYREVVGHPDMSQTLPWLRADVPDDLVIAGALELAWQDLTARVAVVASDRNLQNKARVAGLTRINPNNL